MIRILQVLGGLNRGGAETMIMNYYRAIDRSTMQFDFIIHTTEHQAYYDEIVALGGNIYSFPRFNGRNIFEIKKIWDNFFKEHTEYKILHSHVRSYASVYLPIAKKYGIKTIVHSHSTSNGKGVSSIVKRIMQYPIRFQADYFFGCSKEAGRWLFGRKIVDSKKYHMLQNAIDIEQYKFNPDIRRKYRQEFGLKDEITFIHVGRFHPAKNHEFLLNVFSSYHKTNTNSKLLLVGDGELRTNIEKQIKELNLENYVILTGSRSDVSSILMAADCFLFPSSWEGLPVTVVEAQASGLPCLVSSKVTKDVCISSLVKYLPIDNGVKIWSDNMNNLLLQRFDVSQEIKDSGFDIKEASLRLMNFYKELIYE